MVAPMGLSSRERRFLAVFRCLRDGRRPRSFRVVGSRSEAATGLCLPAISTVSNIRELVRMRYFLSALVIGLLVAIPARAQPTDERTVSVAERLSAEAAEAYSAGNYEKAIALWQQSYDLSKEPELFEHLGNAYERTGRPREARAALSKWRDVAPQAQRALLNRRIASLDARIARLDAETPEEPLPEKTPPPAKPEPQLPPPDAQTLSIPGLVLFSVGGALVFTGVAIDIAAFLERPDQAVCKPTGQRNVCLGSARSSIDGSNTKAIVGDVFWMTGAAVAATGGIIMIVHALSGNDAESVVGLAPDLNLSLSGGGIELEGAF